jgi:signal transduction histidine kinase
VRIHEGVIAAESAPGVGARFDIWLPVDRKKARHG